MASADESLKNFTATMSLPSEYSGIMNIHSFSSPNSGDEDHVYISDTLSISIIPEIDYTDAIQELSFMGSDIIIIRTNSEVGLNPFALTLEGEYINVSVPAVANELGITCSVADGTIAEITGGGKVRGLRQGSTTITAEYNGREISVSVDVDITHEISPIPEATSKDLFITTSSLQAGKVGLSYTQVLNSTLSFTDPVIWTASGLPAGLECGKDGIIGGKPLTHGTYSVDITVSNDNETASKTLALIISPSDNPLAPIISTPSLPVAIVSREYTAVITAQVSGDASAIRWSIYSGKLPEWVSLDRTTGESITLSGIPTEAGSSTFMVMAFINGYDDIQSFTLTVNEPLAPVITTTVLPSGTVGTAYRASLTPSGTPPLVWSIKGGKLPSGLMLSVDVGIISGTPSTSGDFAFTVSATNDAGEASQDFTISIALKPEDPKPEPLPPEDISPDVAPALPEPVKSGDIVPTVRIIYDPERGISSLSAGDITMLSNNSSVNDPTPKSGGFR